MRARDKLKAPGADALLSRKRLRKNTGLRGGGVGLVSLSDKKTTENNNRKAKFKLSTLLKRRIGWY